VKLDTYLINVVIIECIKTMKPCETDEISKSDEVSTKWIWRTDWTISSTDSSFGVHWKWHGAEAQTRQ